MVPGVQPKISLGLAPAAKSDPFAADCARLVERHSARPQADLIHLFERLVFDGWIGESDLHARNLSLLAGPDGRHSLSPAYDIVSSAAYKDYTSALALPLSGEDGLLGAAGWDRFAAACRLARPVAAAIMARPAVRVDEAVDLVARSYVPTRALRGDYRDCVVARAEALEAWSRELPA